jgi:hypothetical protein
MTPDKDRFKQLPKAVRLEDTITTSDTDPVPDPEGGRDTERDFLVRYGLGGL